jgi:amino acid adenylation domain-containing protein
MFKRHEILRTAFLPTDNAKFAFAQLVLNFEEVDFEEIGQDQDIKTFASRSLPALLKSSKPPVRLAVRRNSGAKQLIFCCHHALYDGVAIRTLLREIEDAYNERPLRHSISYERYLTHMASQDLIAADRFWGASLAGLEPTYFPRLTGRNPGSDMVTSLSTSTRALGLTLSHISRFCQATSVTLLPVLQATWAKILHFYCGEEDLCFGNVVSGRTLPEAELDRLVGPCFNTIPVRVEFDFKKSSAELIKQLHVFNIASLEYQLTPLRRINAQVQQGKRSLFDTLLILQQPTVPLDGAIWTINEDTGIMDLPLVCEIVQDNTADELRVTLHYYKSLMSNSDAKLVLETFDCALQSLVLYPGSPARDTVGFSRKILAACNLDPTLLKPKEGPVLHSAFEQNASCRPDHTALLFQHASGMRTVWNFRELNENANQIAHALIERGIGPEDIVPVHIAKSPKFYASILGVLKAGAAFTPVAPDLPPARKAYMVSDLNPKLVLCADHTTMDWCNSVPVLSVNLTNQYARENPIVHGLAPTNLVYCIYTSGSTGVPKAVSMEHGAPIQTIEASRSRIPWRHESRLLQYAATTFDMCYYDCFLAWSYGFTLCTAEQSEMLNDLVGVIRSLKVDLLDLTPSVAATVTKAQVPSVRWLYCIGEAMSSEVVKEWGSLCVNSYGPTEAAFCTTISEVQEDSSANIIGRPFSTTTFTVFPRSGGRVLPVFGVGELYIGGSQLARGYHNRPDLDEDRFTTRNGARWYKSGDIVRMLGDGNFEFIGRVDDQIKIRGLRVELGEINHVIQASDDRIRSVTTQILRKDLASKYQLVSFLETGRQDNEEALAKIRSRAKQAAMEHLPAYMVPRFYVFVASIPKSSAGKIDKNALTTIFCTSGFETRGNNRDHHWTRTETQVREVLAKVSGTPIDEIHPTTSIYHLGLDSVSAVQVATALRKSGLSVSVTDVLKYTNCVDIGTHVDQSSRTDMPKATLFDFESFDRKFRSEISQRIRIRAEDIEAISPCTPLQSGMISQTIAKEGSVYFNYVRLRLNPGIDLRRLCRAWRMAMEAHQILRTGFVHVADNTYPFAMVRYTNAACSISWEDNTDEDKISSEEWLTNIQCNAPGNLHRPPWYIRTVVSKFDSKCIDMAIFHALYDAQSLAAIFDDVSKAYDQSLIQPSYPIEPVLSRILSLSDNQDAEIGAFWEKQKQIYALNRFPNLAPLRLEPLPPAVVSKVCNISISKLEAGCRDANITLQAAGIASWVSILSAYTGEESATCGVVLSGRNFEGAESAVFPCITTVPFVCTVSGDDKKLLEDVMLLGAELQHHQFTPLNRIQRLMGYPTESLFDSLFTFQKMPNSGREHNLWTVVDEKATVEYPLSIELEPKDGKLEMRLTYLPHIVPTAQAELILDQIDHVMNRFIFPKVENLSEVHDHNKLYSITPPKEPAISSEVTLLHEFVAMSAAKSPDSIALEFATSVTDSGCTSTTWTYAELDTQGNKIANMLISHGTPQGSLVGICFDKCPEAYFAILGILKAGCAFVALDPGAPSARQAFIVKDSGVKIVLSKKSQTKELHGIINATLMSLDDMDLGSMSPAKPALVQAIDPGDRSYCLYTSGTTGIPKGCELTHENAVQALLSFQRLFTGHWDVQSRWLQFASFHFDVSVLEQYWSWSVGIRLVSAPRDVIFEDLARTINVLGVTHIDLTPSLARLLHPDDVPSLCRGVFITGGESLKEEILDVWGPKGVIYNGYGPTEATIGVTMYPRVPANGKPSNIGPQFDNVGSFVLKPGSDIPVLRGGVGELCVSGKLVGKGYLNRPQLTDERFPHLARFNERVYRTGDLVRILCDGTFDILGRADDQVKLRGQRLEIGEINSVIKQSTLDFSDVATLVLRHPKQQKEQLVSFIATGTSSRDEPRILIETATSYVETARRSCRERLPGYMVPTHFVVLSAMPLSANNKADHRKLKDMYSALSMPEVQLLSGPSNSNDGLWSNDERKIGKVLQDMLQTSADDIKRTSSVFELGLDSISVIGFCRSLKQAGFPNATASVVMKNSSIEQLCKALSGNRSETHGSSSLLATQQTIAAVQHRHRHTVARSLSLNSQDIESLAPCTPLQQGMIARSLEAEQRLYFNSVYFDILGAVDEDKLRAAWGEAFDCIQILRTVFVNTEEGYVQAVLRNSSLPWNACTLPTNQRLDEGLKRLKSQWCQSNQMTLTRPFELHLVTSTERKVLAVHIFHALYDGISIGLLFKAIWDMFNGHWERNAGTTFHSVLPYGPLLSVGGAREFWKTHFSEHDARPLFLAADDSKSGVVTLDRQINPKGYESVRRRLNVTPQAMAQACWATVLYNYVQGPVTIGMVVSGRSIDLDGAENTIGPMFNTLPYQHKLRPQESWTSIVKRTHDFNVAVHAYQHTPLRDIMKWTKRNPGLPLFDNLFVYQAAEQDQSWAKNDVWVLRAGDADADYPVALEVEQGIGGILKVTLVAQNRFLNEESAMRLLNCFEDALRTVVTNPDEVVSSVFQEMGDNTRKTGLSESNGDPTATDGAYDDLKHFQWTPAARAIKEELVRLAGAQDTDINEATSIFELGLDSIDAIKLSSKLKKRGVDLPVSGIMRGLTIVKMVTTISGAGPTAIEQSTETAYESHIKKLEDLLHRNGLRAIDAERILPLTPLQEGMVAEMLSSGFTRYYNHDVLELAPHVDLDILQRSLMTVVGSSPILRTSFVEIDDPAIDFTFAQVVHRTPHKFLRYLKVDSKPDFQEIFTTLRENAIKAKLMTPLFNITIIDSPGMVSLVLSIAHALYDGWSLTLLHSDILKAYQDQFKPRPDFEPVLKEILTATGSEAATFWQDFLSGSEPSLFRRRLTANAEVHHQIYRMERTSDLNLTDLTSFAKKNKVTLEALGQTVYAITLASYIHSLDVTFGSVFSGRDDENMAEILFPTMNTVAVRTVLHGTRRVMLQYVQETLGNIKQFQHFPLRKSKALSGVQRSLFESLFIFQKAPDAAEAATGTLYRSVYGLSDVEYPVCVELEVFNGIFTWRCALNSEVFDRAGAQGFLTTLDSVLKAVVQEPDAPTILFTSAGASVCGLPPFQTDKVARVDIAIEAVSPSLSAETGASATLKTIREVLAVVSGIPEEQITGDMTIFHIGLDSISAIKVSSLLRKRSITINVGEMLKAGSLENIANIIDQRKPKSEEGPSVSDTASILAAALGEVDQGGILREAGLEGGDVERLLPVTAGQMYMLSMWLNSDGTLFYPDFHYQVTGNMSLKLLQRAWQALVGANPILRTCVLPASATPFHWIQAILKNVKGFVTDVTGQDERSIIEVTRVCARKQPYAHLFVSRTQTGWNLRLQIHHVLYDGVSLPLLIRQYQDLCNGAESPPLSHETFSTFIAGSVTPSALEKRRTFWSGYLGGLAPVLRRLAQPISSPASRTEFFRPALIQDMTRLEGVARKYGISTQAIFLATYARLYASLTAADKNQDVVVGIYLANRSHQTIPKIADSTVPTVNLVPLRVCKPWQEDILEVARQIQDDIQAISTPENASVSLLEVAEWTGVRVDTFVNFLKLPGADVDMEEMEHGSSSAAQEEKHGSGIASAKSKITITQTGDKWTKDISRVAELRHVFDIAEGEETKAVPLVDKRVTSAYLVSPIKLDLGTQN